MKQLIFLIIIALASVFWLKAEENDEIIWETEQVRSLNDLVMSPLGDIFYNISAQTIQIRSVEDGVLLDSITLDDIPNQIYQISISDDGKLMAMSGDNPYIVIYDLIEKRELKRLTTNVFEREEYGKLKTYKTKQWLSSSISPDGTRVTGIAEGDQATSSQCWVVIDIETEEELAKETRLGYDVFNPDKYDISEWISSEFTPDGKYIVSKIDWIGREAKEPDSIYIHDANSLELYDVVLNRYSEDIKYFNLNKNTFTFKPKANSKIFIYNILDKSKTETNIDPYIWTFTFFRNSDIIIYGHENGLRIYDYQNNKRIYDYQLVTDIFTTSLDDSKLFANYHGHIYCLKTFLNETNIRQEYEEEITISPNPTSSYVNINIECIEQNINFQIYSSDSTLLIEDIANNNQNNFTIDFSNYPSGVYFISFLCNEEMKIYKIVKEG